MGFNFGAFAAGAAKSGVDTYTRLGEEERRDAEALQRKEMFDAWKKEQAKNEQIDAAYAETLGRAGTPDAWRTAGGARGPQPESDQTALPADAAAAFPKQKLYDREQAMQDYKNKVMGISASKGAEVLGKMQSLRKGELELEGAERNAKFDKKFDAFNDETNKMVFDLHHEIHDHVDLNGPKGAIDKYASQYKQATGNTVALVGKEVVIKNKEGKVIGKSSDPLEITNALSEALEKNLLTKRGNDMIKAGMFKNAQELQSFLKDRNTMETQTMTAQAHQTSAQAALQNAATQASIAPSTIALHNAQAGMATAHAGVFNQTLELAKTNKEAREAMQPFLDQITKVADPSSPEGKKEVESLTIKAMAAGAAKSTDIKSLLESVTKKPKEPISNKDIIDFIDKFGDSPSNEKDKSTGKAIPIRMLPPAKQKAYAEDFFQKGDGTGGTGGLPTEVKPEARNTGAPAASTNSALPTKTTPAATTAIPTEAPTPIKSVAYGKTGYKMPGMLGVYATPEQAQAAWAQKNAPIAPAGRFD